MTDNLNPVFKKNLPNVINVSNIKDEECVIHGKRIKHTTQQRVVILFNISVQTLKGLLLMYSSFTDDEYLFVTESDGVGRLSGN